MSHGPPASYPLRTIWIGSRDIARAPPLFGAMVTVPSYPPVSAPICRAVSATSIPWPIFNAIPRPTAGFLLGVPLPRALLICVPGFQRPCEKSDGQRDAIILAIIPISAYAEVVEDIVEAVCYGLFVRVTLVPFILFPPKPRDFLFKFDNPFLCVE